MLPQTPLICNLKQLKFIRNTNSILIFHMISVSMLFLKYEFSNYYKKLTLAPLVSGSLRLCCLLGVYTEEQWSV